jgi:hypothetical protein
MWVDANTMGNAVAGFMFTPGDINTCNVSSHMNGCLFLPAAGYRFSGAEVSDQGIYGSYHYFFYDSYQSGFTLLFTSGTTSADMSVAFGHTAAMSVRCVQ